MLGAAPTQAPSTNAAADSSSSVAWAPRRSARWLATASIAALALVLLPAWAGAARPQAHANVLAVRAAAHGAKSRALPRLWVVQVSRGADGWFNRATLKRVRKEGIDALALRISVLGRKPAGERTFGSVREFASAEKLYLVAVLPSGKVGSRTPAARAALAACSGGRAARLRCAVQARSVKAAARLARQHNSVLQLVALYVKGPRRLSKLARLPKSLRRRILVIAPLHGSVGNTSAWGAAIGQTAASPSLYMGVAPHTRKATPGVQEFAALLAGGSSSAAAAPPDTESPSAPTGLVTSSVGQASMTLSWNASSDNVGVAGYRLFVNVSQVGTSKSTSYSFTGLSCGTSYKLGIVAYDAAGNVSAASTLSQSTSACSDPDNQPPSTPAGLSTSSVGQTSMTLSWNASTDNVGVAGYRLFLNGSQVATSGSTSHSFTGLSCGTSYTLGVAAYDAAGNVSGTAMLTQATNACSARSANVYVSTAGNDSTCARGDASRPCASFQRAYDLAQCGDTIGVESGAYYDVTLLSNGSSCSTQTTFVPVGGVVTIAASSGKDTALALGNSAKTSAYKPPDHVTFDGGSSRAFHFGVSGVMGSGGLFGRIQMYADYDTPTYPSHITLENLIVAYDAPDDAQGTIGIDAGQYITIDNDQIGPICCGLLPNGSVGGSPTEIGVGNRDGYAVSDHIVIENNQLLGETYMGSTDWPASLGPPPQPDCTDTDACHADAIHITGGTNFTITGNKIYNSRAQSLFFEPIHGELGGTNLIANNYLDTLNVKCSVCINGGGDGVNGTWNFAFNTGNSGLGFDGGGSYNATATFVGNYASNSGCSNYSGLALFFLYNVWTNGACGATDYAGSPALVVAHLGDWGSNPPDNGVNYDLAAGAPAIGFVPAAICTSYVSADLHGQTRPNPAHVSVCDAGADETR